MITLKRLLIILFLLFLGVHALRIFLLFLDFQAASRLMNAELKTGKIPPPDFLQDLELPDSIEAQDIRLLSTDAAETERDLLLEPVAQLNLAELNRIKTELGSRLEQIMSLSQLPQLPRPLGTIDFSKPSLPDFDILRNTANYWYRLAMRFEAAGDHSGALTLLTSVALLGHLMVAEPAAAVTSINHAIAESFKNLAATGVIRLLNANEPSNLNLHPTELNRFIDYFEKLYQNRCPVSLPLEFESLFIPSLFNSDNHRTYSLLSYYLSQPEIQTQYIWPNYEPLIEASQLSWPEAQIILQQHQEYLISQNALFTDQNNRFRIFGFLLEPELFFIKLLMSLTAVSGRIVESDFKARQLQRGALVALKLAAYRRENLRRYPEVLSELLAATAESTESVDLFVDLYAEPGNFLQFEAEGKKYILFSIGEDMKPRTTDDLIFIK